MGRGGRLGWDRGGRLCDGLVWRGRGRRRGNGGIGGDWVVGRELRELRELRGVVLEF